MPQNKSVIVIGGNHHNTLGVIRSLGRKGIRPYVILTSGDKTSFVLKSKYILSSIVVNTSDEAIDVLLSNFCNREYKPVIIACHDKIASLIDLNREKLSSYFILPGCNFQGAITAMMDKKKMSEFAIKNGLMVPNTFILNPKMLEASNDITFPCITKPVASVSGSKNDIHVCYSKSELTKYISNSINQELLVQQFIDKSTEFQLIGCSLDAGNDIIIPGVSIILRQPSTTNTGFLHYKTLDISFYKTVEKTKKIIQELGFSGLFSVEFIRDNHGDDYFMEINFRNDGNAIAVTNAGVNLPYIWYLNGIGEEYKNEVSKIKEEFVMPEFAELALLAQCEISLRDLWRDMKLATSYMDYDPNDTSPTNGWKLYILCLVRSFAKYFIKRVYHHNEAFKKSI